MFETFVKFTLGLICMVVTIVILTIVFSLLSFIGIKTALVVTFVFIVLVSLVLGKIIERNEIV